MGFFKLWGFFPRGLGIFSNMVIFIPGIGDFFLRGLGTFFSGDWRFLKIWGFLSPGFLPNWGFFIPGIFRDGDFSGMAISHRKATSVS